MGQIFGFYADGKKFIYDNHFMGQCYILVVIDSPVGFYISQSWTKYHKAFFKFSRAVGDKIEDFDRQGIEDAYPSDSSVKARLLDLLDKLPTEFDANSSEDSLKYTNIIRKEFQ
jgi:hypothetical protein